MGRRMRCWLLAGGMALSLLTMTGCQQNSTATETYQELAAQGRKDGEVISLAMPDEWANWKETWTDLSVFYDLKHSDTDMNSGDELEHFANGDGDIGDVGYAYGAEAEKKMLTEKFKTTYWDDIPGWAKDDDGDWIVTYTGTLAFMVKNGEKNAKLSWTDLRDGNYTVGTSDVCTSSQAQYSVYAAALAFGGDAKNIQPGIDFFKKMAQEGRLTDSLHDQQTSIESNVDVNIKWDFVALGYRDVAAEKGKNYSVVIPSDASVTVGYASIINKKAKHLAAAKLAREYILSDAGQMNLASGYATPIRPIVLPAELEEKRIDRSQYNEEMVENGLDFNDDVGKLIADEWKKQVLPILDKEGRVK